MIDCKPNKSRERGVQVKEKNWYVLYTAPRAEKVAKRELEEKGYEVFLPMTRTLRVWKNRQRKYIDSILFPSYIFVYTHKNNLEKIRNVNKVMYYLHCGGKPSKIDSKCIDGIKQLLGLNQKITIGHSFIEGDPVRIVDGPLSGYEGVLVEQKSKTNFGMYIEAISQTILFEIDVNSIERLSPATSVMN